MMGADAAAKPMIRRGLGFQYMMSGICCEYFLFMWQVVHLLEDREPQSPNYYPEDLRGL
jgi:hypothetical protein